MELNAEQIKKALECCSADTADCHSCPYGEFSEGNCFDNAKKDSLALINSQEQRIKEITEENKAWQKSLITQKENADKSYYELACEVENLRAENERLKAKAYGINTVYGIRPEVIDATDIDQIAKEMLEANNERT